MPDNQPQAQLEPVIVRIGVPAWGLPSWDIRSLQLLCLLHFNDVPHVVEYERYGYSSSTGEIPAIEPGDGTIVSAELSIDKYSNQLDNAHQMENTLAYRILCESRVLPICQYILFEDDSNFNRLVYNLFLTTPFPFCAYLPRKLRRQKLARLNSTTKLTQQQRLNLCEHALQVFESKLETDGTPFLLGSKPSSGDAALFAFLMFAKYCPVDPDLKRFITPVLSEYMDQVLSVYPIISKTFETHQRPCRYPISDIESQHRSNRMPPPLPEDQLSAEELSRRRGNRIAFGVAAAAFVGYIVLSSLNRAK